MGVAVGVALGVVSAVAVVWGVGVGVVVGVGLAVAGEKGVAVPVGVRLGKLVGVSVGRDVDICDTGVWRQSVKRQACKKAIRPAKLAPFIKRLLFITIFFYYILNIHLR